MLKYLGGYLLLEVVDYSYWRYLLSKQRNLRNIQVKGDVEHVYKLSPESIQYFKNLPFSEIKLITHFLGNDKTKEYMLFHNFYKTLQDKRHTEDLSYNKLIADNFVEKKDNNYVKNHLSENKLVYIKNKHPHSNLTHMPIFIRLLCTLRYLWFCYRLKSLGFICKHHPTTTVWIRKGQKNNNHSDYPESKTNNKLVLIQHGIAGDIGNIIDIAKEITSEYDIMIPIFLPVHLSYFQTTGNNSDWVTAVYTYCIEYENLYIICHSYGGNLSEYLHSYLKFKSQSHIIKGEIIIESASTITACLTGYSTLFNSIFDQWKKFNTYSTKTLMNIGLLYILYSTVGKFAFYSSSPFRGCQYTPRDNQVFLLSDNDPVLPSIKESTIHNDIKIYQKSKNNRIVYRKGYHGGWLKKNKEIVAILNSFSKIEE
jgi:hypothetical protein